MPTEEEKIQSKNWYGPKKDKLQIISYLRSEKSKEILYLTIKGRNSILQKTTSAGRILVGGPRILAAAVL